MNLDAIRLGVWWITVTLLVAGSVECFALAFVTALSIGDRGSGIARIVTHAVRRKSKSVSKKLDLSS